MNETLNHAKDEFVTQWGALGSCWGVNRTMAQIHALLMVSATPLTTDQVMQELKISRGNSHSNLKELVGWGLVRSVTRMGERKELFEAEKDVWKIFCIVARERSRREIEPAIKVLEQCTLMTKDAKGAEASAFNKQLTQLYESVQLADKALKKIASGEKNTVFNWVFKLLK